MESGMKDEELEKIIAEFLNEMRTSRGAHIGVLEDALHERGWRTDGITGQTWIKDGL